MRKKLNSNRMAENTSQNPETGKEARRKKIARQYYEYYAMLEEVEKDLSRIMGGGSSDDTPAQQHAARRIRHAVKSWVHALTVPVESGLVSQFTTSSRFIALEEDMDLFSRYVKSDNYTWAQKIAEMKKYCKKMIAVVYKMPFEQWRGTFASDIQGSDLIEAFLAKQHKGEE